MARRSAASEVREALVGLVIPPAELSLGVARELESRLQGLSPGGSPLRGWLVASCPSTADRGVAEGSPAGEAASVASEYAGWRAGGRGEL